MTYKKFWSLIGDISIFILTCLIFINIAINYNIYDIYKKGDGAENLNQNLNQNDNFSLIQINALLDNNYPKLDEEISLALDANLISFNEIEFNIEYDQEFIKNISNFNKNYNCQVYSNDVSIHFSCLKESSNALSNNKDIVIANFKPIKKGFTSISLSEIKAYDSSGKQIDIEQPKNNKFGMAIIQ